MEHQSNCIGFVCTCKTSLEQIFKKGNKIRHVNTLDVDLIVHDVRLSDSSDFVELKVWYFNRHYNILIGHGPDPVCISKSDAYKWSVIE